MWLINQLYIKLVSKASFQGDLSCTDVYHLKASFSPNCSYKRFFFTCLLLCIVGSLILCILPFKIRVGPRFFDQVGHQTTNAYIGNEYLFTKKCHSQTYQDYEQSQQKLGTFLVNKVVV